MKMAVEDAMRRWNREWSERSDCLRKAKFKHGGLKDCTLELGGCEYYHQTTAGSGLSTDQEISKLPVEVLHSVLERRIQSDRQRKASGKSNLRH
jgi:hypothetical protein